MSIEIFRPPAYTRNSRSPRRSAPARHMRLSQGDIDQYAEWSGDRNPLHGSSEFGRRTFFRQTVAHGMLSVTRALALADSSGTPPRVVDIEFRGAIFPEGDYQVGVDRSRRTITVRKDDDVALKI